jgi:hypothetical protein
MRGDGARGARGPGLDDQIVVKGGAWKTRFRSRFSLVLVIFFKFVVS